MESVSREKLVIGLPEDVEASAETVWVMRDARRDDLFKLDNIPAFAYGLALNDVVRAVRQDDGRFHFVELFEPSGLLTVRLAGPGIDDQIFEPIAGLLRRHAIGSERYGDRHIGYAMRADAFLKIENQLDAMIGDSEDLAFEVAND